MVGLKPLLNLTGQVYKVIRRVAPKIIGYTKGAKSMKIHNILTVGLIIFLVPSIIGLIIYHGTYKRESYDIAECTQKYQFLNLTVPRRINFALNVLLNPAANKLSTVLLVYSANELQEEGLLNTLYLETTDDPEVFLEYEEKSTGEAVVLLKTIPSQNEGGEPIFCVVSKDKVSVKNLLNNQDTFFIGTHWRTKHGLPITEQVRRVISRWPPR